MPTVPIWLVALVVAGLAPLAVGALQSWHERRVRKRTLEVLTRARRAATPDAGVDSSGGSATSNGTESAPPEDGRLTRRDA